MPADPRIYLAGPSIFRADAARIGERLRALCKRYGVVGIYPMEGDTVPSPPVDLRAIFDSNLRLISQSDAVIADMSPFRGPHVDDGTAFEIGFAYALGKAVFGYSNSLETLVEKIPHSRQEGIPRDADGCSVEDYGQPVNLMLAGAAGDLHGSAEEAIAAAARLLRR
jgi:nucleoside 2-deoxyribosyltransferase